jgi:hypothetical protein
LLDTLVIFSHYLTGNIDATHEDPAGDALLLHEALAVPQQSKIRIEHGLPSRGIEHGVKQ